MSLTTTVIGLERFSIPRHFCTECRAEGREEWSTGWPALCDPHYKTWIESLGLRFATASSAESGLSQG